MSDSDKANVKNDDIEIRKRYYMSIKSKGEFSETFIQPPAHCLNPNLFVISQSFNEEKEGEEPKRNKSWITILSVWNTMIGSGIVSIPFYSKNAGIIPTIVFNIIYGLICFYTCQVIVKTGGKDNDYSDTVARYFGKRFGKFGRVIQIIFNLLINVGAAFIYFLIINQNLYPNLAKIINVMGGSLDAKDYTPSFSHFSTIYCGILVGIVLFPLLIMKDIGFLIKINSYGVIFVLVLLTFVFGTGFYALFTTNFDFQYKENSDNPSENRHLYLFGDNPSMLAGALTMGYFSHSFVLSMMKSNEKQENNKRDLFLGYCLVCLTYTLIGLLGYVGFSASTFEPKFEDNWFKFFSPDNIFVLVLRFLSVIQLCSILPIIVFVIRIQFFGTFYNNNYPSKTHVTIFSTILVIFSLFILYFCYDSLGKLMSFIGAGTGLVLIYFVPLIVNMVYYKIKHPTGKLREELVANENGVSNGINYDSSNTTSTALVQPIFSEVLNGPHIYSKKEPSKIKDNLFYVSQILLIGFGVFTLIIQFFPINFFNIHINK